jgi:branched-chain amino acid aminotransferase
MSHPSLSQLQRPAFAVNGELVAYDDVKVHISAEAFTRALSVFEGMKGYWDLESREFGVQNPRQHYGRLCRSAALLHIDASEVQR